MNLFGGTPSEIGRAGARSRFSLVDAGGGDCCATGPGGNGEGGAMARGDEVGAVDRPDARLDGGDAAQGTRLYRTLFLRRDLGREALPGLERILSVRPLRQSDRRAA